MNAAWIHHRVTYSDTIIHIVKNEKKCINKFSYCIDSTIVLPLYMLGLGGGWDLNLLDSRACYKITKIPPTHHRKKYTLGPRTWYKLYFTEPELICTYTIDMLYFFVKYMLIGKDIMTACCICFWKKNGTSKILKTCIIRQLH